jgi:hypothetical protein
MAGARTVRGDPYDPAVDSNTARAVLRLDPAAPLTPEAVEQSFQREAWERHPSRYPDPEGRAAAEAWAATLGEARVVLLHAAAGHGTADVPVSGPFEAQPGATDSTTAAPGTRRRLSRGAVIGIVAGAVALVAVLAVAGVGAALLASSAIEQSRVAAEESEAAEAAEAGIDEPVEAPAESADGSAGVERIEADETAFTSPAALEMYADGRYAHLCGLEHLEGCWESAVFVEADCATVEIELGFSNDEDMWAPAEETRTITESDVTTGEALPVVFGNDAYDYGWLQDVRCTTAAG